MKIILSRKGFDSENGGQQSPVMPDGTLLSLPIPSKDDNVRFTDLYYQNTSYYDVIRQLKPSTKIKANYTCHLDPDIRIDAIARDENWKGLFGQVDAAQKHLHNQGVGTGDLFLFYGWFRETEEAPKGLRYIHNAPDLHVIYGYLQIGRMYSLSEELPSYAVKHPHASRFNKKNNCIYEASDRLSLCPSMPGFGCLSYKKSVVLTKDNEPRSHWNLPDVFRQVPISYHTVESFKDGYFESAKKGQEFVINANEKAIEYFTKMICE